MTPAPPGEASTQQTADLPQFASMMGQRQFE